MADTKKTKTQEFTVKGGNVVKKLKEIIKQGNARSVILKNEKGKTILRLPLTLGAIGFMLIPVWIIIGAIAALSTKMTIVVEKN